MFSSINKTFGCCSKIFGCSNKKIFVVPNFVAVTKPFFFREQPSGVITKQGSGYPTFDSKFQAERFFLKKEGGKTLFG